MATCLVVGLPDAGKSSFLAALYHVVEAGNVEGALTLSALSADREHLNSIRQAWLECREIGRTTVASEQTVHMSFSEAGGQDGIALVFPDLSGETFRRMWTDRAWPVDFDLLVRDSVAILLLVHPERIVPPVRIDQARPLLALVGGDVGVASGPDAASDWLPESSPTQVILVDILQSLVAARHAADLRPARICVIVSAWDLVPSGAEPARVIKDRLPLLYQFLEANASTQEWRAFGVSAFGGDPTNDLETLRAQVLPESRIKVAGASGAPNDISAPVRWVLGRGE
jgi:hypothetical protein